MSLKDCPPPQMQPQQQEASSRLTSVDLGDPRNVQERDMLLIIIETKINNKKNLFILLLIIIINQKIFCCLLR